MVLMACKLGSYSYPPFIVGIFNAVSTVRVELSKQSLLRNVYFISLLFLCLLDVTVNNVYSQGD